MKLEDLPYELYHYIIEQVHDMILYNKQITIIKIPYYVAISYDLYTKPFTTDLGLIKSVID